MLNGRNAWLSAALAAVAVMATGCGKDEAKGSVSTELRRVGTVTGASVSGGVNALSTDANSEITIQSLKFPIRTVNLKTSADDSGVPVYQCAAGTNDGCLVDLMSGAALSNLLSSSTNAADGKIPAGTYTHVSVATCESEGGYTAKVKASGEVTPGAGVTHYTKADSKTLTTTVGDHGEATVYFSGCVRSYPIPTPVTIAENGSINLKLYFQGYGIAFFGQGDGTDGDDGVKACYAGGCSWPYTEKANGTFVGVGYMDVAATIDDGEPTAELYQVDRTGSSGTDHMLGIVGLLYNSSGQYFGGFTRALFNSTSAVGNNSFVTPIQTFSETSSGVYTVENYGSSSSGAGYIKIQGFQRSSSAQNDLVCTSGSDTYSCDVTKITL